MPLFSRGGTEMKKIMAFIGMLVSIAWLTIALYHEVTTLWFLAYCIFMAFVGGPYFTKKLFEFLAVFVGGKGGRPND